MNTRSKSLIDIKNNNTTDFKQSDVVSVQLLRQSSPELPRSPAPFASLKAAAHSNPQLDQEEHQEHQEHKECENVYKELYEVNIDFDGASEAWRANKKSTGGGCYKYICEAKTATNKCCLRQPMNGSIYCKMHCKNNK